MLRPVALPAPRMRRAAGNQPGASSPAGSARPVVLAIVAAALLRQIAAVSFAGALETSAYLPDRVVAAATLRDGDRQLRALREFLDEAGFVDSPLYRNLVANPGVLQAQIGLAGMAATAGLDPWGAAGAVLGRELTIGLAPRAGGKPAALLVIAPREAAALDRLLSVVHSMTGLVVDGQPDPGRSEKLGDVVVFHAHAELHHCRVDDALLVANDTDLLRAALEAKRRGDGRLCDLAAWRRARERVPRDAAAWVFVDAKRLLAEIGERRELPAQLPNPLGGFLFGGWWHTLRTAEQVVAWLELAPRELRLAASVESTAPLPQTHRGYVWNGDAGLNWDATKLPAYLSEVVVGRDWSALFAEREALLTLPAAGDLVNFSNTMTTLMGQLDFADGLLPVVNGPVRLILTRQDFSGRELIPTPKLPAFALIVPLKLADPVEFGRRLQSASQMALTLINADAMQKNEPAFLLDVDRYRDVRMVYAEYPREGSSSMMAGPAGGEPMPAGSAPAATQPRAVGVRYNFAPAAAVVKDTYVVATSRKLLEAIIDRALVSPGEAPVAAGRDCWRVSLRELVAVLRDNREEMVIQNMLAKDHARAAAEGEIDTLLGLLDFGHSAELTARTAEKSVEATLTLRFRTPQD
ncbi:MAG: hypothetical protein HRF50_11465 [Phycisphaerae bacterium]|jgi:hypothetical protein